MGIRASRRNAQEEYGSRWLDPRSITTPGQLGSLPPGTPPDALVSSPPYAGAGQVLGTHNGIDWSKAQDGGKESTPARVASGEGYGVTPGQLGHMAIVGSPPYAESLNSEKTRETRPDNLRYPHGTLAHGGCSADVYGHSPGQLGAMPAGLVSSPPWEDSTNGDTRTYGGIQASPHRSERQQGGHFHGLYGTSPEQLGNTTGDTFWSAADAVMREVSALLPVGGIACWVVKAYIKNKAIVPFDTQWQALCEAHGFETVEIIHASLIEDHGTQETLFGEAEAVQIKRASFFRRLAEKKGSPPIDAEVVLIMRKEHP